MYSLLFLHNIKLLRNSKFILSQSLNFLDEYFTILLVRPLLWGTPGTMWVYLQKRLWWSN